MIAILLIVVMKNAGSFFAPRRPPHSQVWWYQCMLVSVVLALVLVSVSALVVLVVVVFALIVLILALIAVCLCLCVCVCVCQSACCTSTRGGGGGGAGWTQGRRRESAVSKHSVDCLLDLVIINNSSNSKLIILLILINNILLLLIIIIIITQLPCSVREGWVREGKLDPTQTGHCYFPPGDHHAHCQEVLNQCLLFRSRIRGRRMALKICLLI